MRPFLAPTVLAAMAAASPALAAPLAFTDAAAWAAAAGTAPIPVLMADVDPLPPGTTDVGPFSIRIDRNDDGDTRVDGGVFEGDIDASPEETSEIDFVDFDIAITGFGAEFFSTTTGDLLTVTINGVTFRFDTLLTSDGDGFVGFYDPAGITTLAVRTEMLTTDGEAFDMADVRLIPGEPVETPTPAALALFGLGALVLAAARRR